MPYKAGVGASIIVMARFLIYLTAFANLSPIGLRRHE